jgi:uncharacterized membrane protein
VFYQIVSLVGAVLILLAYGLNQSGRLHPSDRAYSLMNLIGASLLTWVAVVDRRAGFVLVEGAWAVMSLIPLLRARPGARG